MTAAEIARELKLTHANVSYHLRQLHAAGTIEAAGEEHIRGGVAKRYRYVIERDLTHSPSTGTPGHVPQRRAMYTALATELRRRAKHLRHSPGRSHFTDAELWIDPEIWGGIRARIEAASVDLHRAAKPPRTPGTIRVNASIALFEMEADS